MFEPDKCLQGRPELAGFGFSIYSATGNAKSVVIGFFLAVDVNT
jgi:hypothetical protein